MDEQLESLASSGIVALESSFTALDSYFDIKPAPLGFAVAPCALQDLATVFDELEYPGTHYADAAVAPDPAGGRRLYLRCADSPGEEEPAAFAPLDLLRDSRRDVFLDPRGVYPSLRAKTARLRPAEPERQLFEAAVLASRYGYELEGSCRLPPGTSASRPSGTCSSSC